MEKNIGKEYANAVQREAFVEDNCDVVENKGYVHLAFTGCKPYEFF